jgi:zinc protease
MNSGWAAWKRCAGLGGLFIFFAIARALAEAPASPEKVATIEGITEYRLDNGLRVLLFPDPSTANVTVNLTVFVGSRHEGAGETGMAHLLEHMVFKGTPRHRDVPRALRDHGAQFNGTTWVDRTNYFETMAGTDENLEFALDLEADRLVSSFVKREDLVSEMTVVRNEFESGENNPDGILRERMMSAAYLWHNYGKSTIGNRSDIERVPIEKLQVFYKKFYQPDNCILIVAGKFDPARALALIGKTFGALKRPTRPIEVTYSEEPPQDGERVVTLRRVGKIGCVGAVYHTPAGAHEDSAAIQMLADVLTSEPSGRLYKALVTSKKATGVSATAYTWHDPGVLQVVAQVDPNGSVEDVRNVMVDVLENLKTQPITLEEVERSKRELLTQRELLITKSNLVGRILSEWAAMGDWRLFFIQRDRLAKVSPADVNRVAARYLVTNNRTVGLYYPTTSPQRAAIPATPSVETLVKNYVGTQNLAAGEAFDPTPENIEKRTERSELPVGLKLALLSKKTRGETVDVHLALHYGNEESLKGHTSATQFLASLMQRGTQKHNRQQIRDRLNQLGARLRAGGLLGDAQFTLEVKRGHLAESLQLLREILREPSFPVEELDVLKRETRSSLERGLTEPSALAFREMQRRQNPYPPDDVRYVPTIQESITRLDAVTCDEVRKLYQEQFGAQAGELAIVGDFDVAQIRKEVEDLFGDFKAPTPYRRIERPARTEVQGSRHTILTPDKANAFYMAGQAMALGDTDPDFAALELADFLFGGGSLSSRLGNRVRQKEGLSYGVGSRFTAGAQDKAAQFAIFAICNPVNIEKVDHAISDELAKLLHDGVSEKELNDAKKAYLEQLKVRRANDAALAGTLADELFNKRTFAYYSDLEHKIAALTPDQVATAARRHIVPEKLIIVQAGDFKKQTSDRR